MLRDDRPVTLAKATRLGIIMALLLGWQFTLAEFVGGPIIIVLVAVVFRIFVRQRLIDAAVSRPTRAWQAPWRATRRWTCPSSATAASVPGCSAGRG